MVNTTHFRCNRASFATLDCDSLDVSHTDRTRTSKNGTDTGTADRPPEIRAAEDRLHDDPEHLTLRDLLLTDFWPNTECHIGEVTLPLKTKPTVTLGVFFDREMASKFLAFYIPKQDFKRDLTGVIAAYLAAQYQYFLD